MSPEEVPIAQKKIIAAANRHAKVVITATQMLDSMINNPRPTRAEATDVANAIFDGTDAVMLSAETAAGKYPVQAVEMMQAIICQAERNMEQYTHWHGDVPAEVIYDDTYYVSRAARELAHDRNVSAIIVFTQSGRTARMMSKMRPSVPIIAFTPDAKTYHRLNLLWGVRPWHAPHVNSLEEMLTILESSLAGNSGFAVGQQVVLICGYPIYATLPTNMTLLYTLGSNMK
jgi:pyruvate kinase